MEHGKLRSRIKLIVSNRKDAGIFDIAKTSGIPHLVIDPSDHESESAYTDAILKLLEDHNIDLILLAGYMKKIPSAVVASYRHRIMNIHPALLPAFGGKGMYGIRVHQAAVEYGVKVSGATVHFVDDEYDHGPVIMQRTVPVEDADTAETLAARILDVEHQIYSEAVGLFEAGRITVEGRKVYIT